MPTPRNAYEQGQLDARIDLQREGWSIDLDAPFEPEPPHESEGGSDCRSGGSCGLGGFLETRRSRWINARFWIRREQKGRA